ncbi:MAG: hypothetical protein R3F49_02120 [Planctomycetota bacterium]
MTSWEVLAIVVAALGAVAFYTWALEMHRTLREVLIELRRIRDELEQRSR